MAIVPIRIPRLQGGRAVVDANGIPTNSFLRTFNDALGLIESTLNAVIDAQNAADAAKKAADTAQTAADNAQKAADQAQGGTREQALVSSYIAPRSVVTATKLVISIVAHTRYYGDGTSVPVNAGTVQGTDFGDTDDVWYVDPDRTGGAVTYVTGTDGPAQGNDVHVVGSVSLSNTTTPVTGSPGPGKPGYS
jgi:type II secretory pathway pseudopilin PulG